MTRVAGRMRMLPLGLLGVGLLVGGSAAAMAQPLDLSQGGPITITARDGLEWHQEQQEVIASGDARAVRENVTVSADRLIAYYRKNPAAAAGSASGAAPRAATATGASVARWAASIRSRL
jgi:lipopolysaccharide export system protein LptA